MSVCVCVLRYWDPPNILYTPPHPSLSLSHSLCLRHKEVYTWSNPFCCVHNVILGKLWIEQYGTVEIVNHRCAEVQPDLT